MAFGLAFGLVSLAGCGSDGPLGPIGGPGSTPAQYTVKRGETLGGIAKSFGLDPGEVARLNGISDPNLIRVGQVLRLPSSASRQDAALRPAPIVPASAPAAPPRPAATAQISPGPAESAPVPSQPFSRTVSVVALDPPPAASAAAPSAASNPVQASPPKHPAVPNLVQRAPPTPVPSGEKTVALTDLPPKDPLPPATGTVSPRTDRSGRLSWPLDGPILSEFGTKEGGLHNDGINIGAPRGAAVRAADDGMIAYTGNELRGFGNLVLIRHENGWTTAYAHLDRMLVRYGDKVRRGQQIGTVGSTGSITTPQLHFEVRKGSRSADPREFLEPRSGVRKASGPGGPRDPG